MEDYIKTRESEFYVCEVKPYMCKHSVAQVFVSWLYYNYLEFRNDITNHYNSDKQLVLELFQKVESEICTIFKKDPDEDYDKLTVLNDRRDLYNLKYDITDLLKALKKFNYNSENIILKISKTYFEKLQNSLREYDGSDYCVDASIIEDILKPLIKIEVI